MPCDLRYDTVSDHIRNKMKMVIDMKNEGLSAKEFRNKRADIVIDLFSHINTFFPFIFKLFNKRFIDAIKFKATEFLEDEELAAEYPKLKQQCQISIEKIHLTNLANKLQG